MTIFDRVPVPAWDVSQGGVATLRQVDHWLASPPMFALVHAFGGSLAGLSPAEIPGRLQAFAAAHWDFRKGHERDSAERADFDEDKRELITSAAAALGLADSSPPRSARYDAVLVLGGLIRACIVRPRYAAQLIRDGLTTREVVALGAFRPLSSAEQELSARMGFAAEDELTAMTEGVKAAFGELLVGSPNVAGRDVVEDEARSWRTISWRTSHDGPAAFGQVSIVAAPTSRPGAARANTSETYDFWAGRLRAPAITSVLVITHPVYVPYQGCAAIQVLGLEHGLDVETVGVSSEAADLGPETQEFGPQQFLQEIRAGIDAMLQLRSAIRDRLRQ